MQMETISKETMMGNKKGYWWVPSLYFAEALPYVAVMVISTMMYKRMGMTNTELAFYTSWLYLPWVVKPLWSPLVDALRSKRWWILSMQLLIGGGFAGIALSIPTSSWVQASLACFWLLAFSSATHDIAADGFYILALDDHAQAYYVGIRSTFYRIATILGQGLLVMLAGWLERSHSVPVAWSVVFYVLCGLFVALAAWHNLVLPRVREDGEARCGGSRMMQTFGQFADTWLTFFRKPQIVAALLFMLLFRFPEAQLTKIAQPFMLDSVAVGGLGLTTETVGFAYGTVGVVGLTLGGLLGGWMVSRWGLRRLLWPMVMSISFPDAVYIYLSMAQPGDLWVINACVFVEQFGYGFGFTAYMLYLIYFARGANSTSVYALCTAFMALGMMLPGMVAGWLADCMGYVTFFIYVTICCAVTFIVSAFLKIDGDYGLKKGNRSA